MILCCLCPISKMSEKIQVCVKMRGLLPHEKDVPVFWSAKENSVYAIDPQTKTLSGESSIFDHVFSNESTNDEVFDILVKPLVDATVRGFNATVFAYGQTASGKTHTMLGNKKESGIIQLSVASLFEMMRRPSGREFLVRASYLEIYNERVNDLLEPVNENLKIREDDGKIVVVNLKEEIVADSSKVMALLKKGQKFRKQATTNLNERSSRSHTIFRMVVESRMSDDEEGTIQVSQLNLVDLAGSERAGLAGTSGERLKEGCSINLSLFQLGHVVSQLSEGQTQFVSFRDSKLTRILQNSLGGNALTVIICTVTPTSLEFTQSTLGFACRAKSVKNKPQVNEVMADGTLLKKYAHQLDKLKAELEALKKRRSSDEQEAVERQLEKEKQINSELQARIDTLRKQLIVAEVKLPLNKRRQTWGGGHLCIPRSTGVSGLPTINENEPLPIIKAKQHFEMNHCNLPYEDFEVDLLQGEQEECDGLDTLYESPASVEVLRPYGFNSICTTKKKTRHFCEDEISSCDGFSDEQLRQSWSSYSDGTKVDVGCQMEITASPFSRSLQETPKSVLRERIEYLENLGSDLSSLKTFEETEREIELLERLNQLQKEKEDLHISSCKEKGILEEMLREFEKKNVSLEKNEIIAQEQYTVLKREKESLETKLYEFEALQKHGKSSEGYVKQLNSYHNNLCTEIKALNSRCEIEGKDVVQLLSIFKYCIMEKEREVLETQRSSLEHYKTELEAYQKSLCTEIAALRPHHELQGRDLTDLLSIFKSCIMEKEKELVQHVKQELLQQLQLPTDATATAAPSEDLCQLQDRDRRQASLVAELEEELSMQRQAQERLQVDNSQLLQGLRRLRQDSADLEADRDGLLRQHDELLARLNALGQDNCELREKLGKAAAQNEQQHTQLQAMEQEWAIRLSHLEQQLVVKKSTEQELHDENLFLEKTVNNLHSKLQDAFLHEKELNEKLEGMTNAKELLELTLEEYGDKPCEDFSLMNIICIDKETQNIKASKLEHNDVNLSQNTSKDLEMNSDKTPSWPEIDQSNKYSPKATNEDKEDVSSLTKTVNDLQTQLDEAFKREQDLRFQLASLTDIQCSEEKEKSTSDKYEIQSKKNRIKQEYNTGDEVSQVQKQSNKDESTELSLTVALPSSQQMEEGQTESYVVQTSGFEEKLEEVLQRECLLQAQLALLVDSKEALEAKLQDFEKMQEQNYISHTLSRLHVEKETQTANAEHVVPLSTSPIENTISSNDETRHCEKSLQVLEKLTASGYMTPLQASVNESQMELTTIQRCSIPQFYNVMERKDSFEIYVQGQEECEVLVRRSTVAKETQTEFSFFKLDYHQKTLSKHSLMQSRTLKHGKEFEAQLKCPRNEKTELEELAQQEREKNNEIVTLQATVKDLEYEVMEALKCEKVQESMLDVMPKENNSESAVQYSELQKHDVEIKLETDAETDDCGVKRKNGLQSFENTTLLSGGEETSSVHFKENLLNEKLLDMDAQEEWKEIISQQYQQIIVLQDSICKLELELNDSLKREQDLQERLKIIINKPVKTEAENFRPTFAFESKKFSDLRGTFFIEENDAQHTNMCQNVKCTTDELPDDELKRPIHQQAFKIEVSDLEEKFKELGRHDSIIVPEGKVRQLEMELTGLRAKLDAVIEEKRTMERELCNLVQERHTINKKTISVTDKVVEDCESTLSDQAIEPEVSYPEIVSEKLEQAVRSEILEIELNQLRNKNVHVEKTLKQLEEQMHVLQYTVHSSAIDLQYVLNLFMKTRDFKDEANCSSSISKGKESTPIVCDISKTLCEGENEIKVFRLSDCKCGTGIRALIKNLEREVQAEVNCKSDIQKKLELSLQGNEICPNNVQKREISFDSSERLKFVDSEDTQAMFDELHKKYQEELSRRGELEYTMMCLENQLTNAQKTISILEKKLQDCYINEEKLEDQIEGLKKDVMKQEREVGCLSDKKLQLELQLNDSENGRELLKGSLDELKEEYRILTEKQTTNIELECRLETLQKQKNEVIIHEKDLQNQMKCLENKLKEYECTISDLESKFYDSCHREKTLDKQVALLESTVLDLKKQLQYEEKRKLAEHAELNETRCIKERLQCEALALESTLCTMREEISLQKNEFKTKSEKLVQKEQELQELLTLKNNLEEDLFKKGETLNELKKCLLQKNACEEDLYDAKLSKDQFQKQVLELRNLLLETQEMHSIERQKLEEKSARLLQHKQAELETLQTAKDNLEIELCKNCEKLQEIEKCLLQNNVLEIDLRDARSAKDQLQNQVLELKDILWELQEKHSIEKQELKVEAETNLKHIQVELENLQAAKDQVENEYGRSCERILQFENTMLEKVQYAKNLEQNIEQLQCEYSKLQIQRRTENEMANNEIKNLEVVKYSIERELLEYKNCNVSLEKKLDTTREEQHALLKHIHDLENTKVCLETQLLETSQEKEKLISETSMVMQKTQRLEEELRNKTEEIIDLKNTVLSLQQPSSYQEERSGRPGKVIDEGNSTENSQCNEIERLKDTACDLARRLFYREKELKSRDNLCQDIAKFFPEVVQPGETVLMSLYKIIFYLKKIGNVSKMKSEWEYQSLQLREARHKLEELTLKKEEIELSHTAATNCMKSLTEELHSVTELNSRLRSELEEANSDKNDLAQQCQKLQECLSREQSKLKIAEHKKVAEEQEIEEASQDASESDSKVTVARLLQELSSARRLLAEQGYNYQAPVWVRMGTWTVPYRKMKYLEGRVKELEEKLSAQQNPEPTPECRAQEKALDLSLLSMCQKSIMEPTSNKHIECLKCQELRAEIINLERKLAPQELQMQWLNDQLESRNIPYKREMEDLKETVLILSEENKKLQLAQCQFKKQQQQQQEQQQPSGDDCMSRCSQETQTEMGVRDWSMVRAFGAGSKLAQDCLMETQTVKIKKLEKEKEHLKQLCSDLRKQVRHMEVTNAKKPSTAPREFASPSERNSSPQRREALFRLIRETTQSTENNNATEEYGQSSEPKKSQVTAGKVVASLHLPSRRPLKEKN